MTGKLLPLRRIVGVTAEMSDDALIAACQGGDPAALGALFDRHGAPVYRFIRRLVADDARDEIEDLVQSTFETVAKGSRRHDAGSARAWLFGIAHNVVRHHLRSARRRRLLAARLDREPFESHRSPHLATAMRLDVERVGKALEQLSYDLRSVFVMCYLEGMSGKQAAGALGIREGTVWKRLHQARGALRRALAKGGDDDS